MSASPVKFHRSLTGRMMLLGGLPTVLILTGIIIHMTFEMFSQARENNAALLRNLTEQVALEVERSNSRAVVVAQTMALAQQHELFGDRLASSRLARQVLQEFPEFTGAYFGYEPNADQDDAAYLNSPEHRQLGNGLDSEGRFLPYWFRDAKDPESLLLNPLIDMETSLYYQGTRELMQQAGRPAAMVTEPYIYEGKMIVEQVYPIVIDGRFVGIAGVDRSLNDIDRFLHNIKARSAVDIFLISRSGRFIATTAEETLQLKTRAIHETLYEPLFAEFYTQRSENAFKRTTDPFDHQRYYYSSAPVATGEWLVVLRKPESEIDAPIWRQLYITLAITLAGLFVVLSLGLWLTRSMSRRIGKSMAAADSLALGGLPQQQALQMTTEDEIGHLSDSFNQVVERYRDITDACIAVAEGDFSPRVVKRSDKDRLADAINTMTERRQQAEAELLAAKEAADAANKAKSAFLANMSHEIRTPMNAVLGFTEILAGVITDAQQKQYLRSIQTSGKSLLTLINDILDLSKVEAGKLELEYTAVDPQGVFREMEQVFSQKMAEKDLDFSVEFGSELPQALILDEVRVRQVLINLIGNAVKFTNQGHVKLSVRNLHPEENRSKLDLLIEVEDTGKGIPQDQQERVFGAFEQQREQSISEYGGTGLGLAISKRLVGLMGGEIQVISEEGRGSTFQVTLRGVPVAAVSELEAQAAPAIDVNAVTFEPATILVTDDIEVNRNLVRGYLEQYGLNLLEAENGKEAVEVTKRYHPDVVLMDMKMPVMNGYEATQMIKGDPEIRDIPVVALTASAMEQAVEEIKALCDGYLRKPVSKADLVGELARLLPHSLAETGSQGPSPSREEEPKAWSLEALDAEARARLPELVEILESRQETCETLRNTMSINDIEDFANLNRETGTEYRYPPLLFWGERLGGQAEMFDLEGLSATLASYPDLIQNIKSITPV